MSYIVIPIFSDVDLHPLHFDNNLSLLYVNHIGEESYFICRFHPDCGDVLQDYKWLENDCVPQMVGGWPPLCVETKQLKWSTFYTIRLRSCLTAILEKSLQKQWTK